MTIQDKKDKLLSLLASYGKAALAFSGGTDSALLAAALVQAVGAENALAIHVDTDLHSNREKDLAQTIADKIGIRFIGIHMDVFSITDIVENGGRRCYFCKKTTFKRMQEIAHDEGFDILLDAGNFDDASDVRPGKKAVVEMGIICPLELCGITRKDVLDLSAEFGVMGYDRPSLACLATRMPAGIPLTKARLKQIDRSEAALEKLGFSHMRVRYHGDVARIEMTHDEWEKAVEGDMPQVISRAVKASGGFRFVALDLEGYRKGSLNEAPLPSEDKA